MPTPEQQARIEIDQRLAEADWIVQDRDEIKLRAGRGWVMDNIFTKRLWQSVKYEGVYLHDYASLREARQSWRIHFHFYNFERPHKAMDYRTLAELYYQGHAAQMLFAERRSLA